MQEKVIKMGKLKRYRYILIGVLFGTIFWFAETASYVFIFGGGEFLEHLINPGPVEFRIRVLMGLIIMSFSVFVQYNMNRREILERQLVENGQKFRMITESTSDLICKVDLEGNYTYLSPSYVQLGYNNEELIGNSGFDYVHPEDVELLLQILEDNLKNPTKESSQTFESRTMDSDGNWRYLETTANFIFNEMDEPDSILLVSRDVSDRKLAEEALVESEEKYRILVDNAGEAIVVAQGPVLKFVNPKACEMTGYSQEEMTTIPFIELVHQEDRGLVLSNDVSRIKGEDPPPTYMFRILTKDGTQRWVEINAVRITWEDDVATLNFLSDITERKIMEDKLDHMIDQLAEKNQELEDYTYTVSHDLKTPLVTIQGFAQLLMNKGEDKMDNKSKHYMTRIIESSERLAKLVSDLLEHSRAGRIPENLSEQDVNKIIQVSLNGVEGLANENGVRFVHGDDFPQVVCDEVRLEQVFSNLIGNSMHYMGDQQDPEVQVGWSDDTPGFYTFWVRDNGMGIKKEDQARIFKVFERATDNNGGTGIGLSIVKKAVESHGGKVWLESEYGKGSTFYFSLPRQEVCT